MVERFEMTCMIPSIFSSTLAWYVQTTVEFLDMSGEQKTEKTACGGVSALFLMCPFSLCSAEIDLCLYPSLSRNIEHPAPEGSTS